MRIKLRAPGSLEELGPWVVGLGCLWEVVALSTNLLPTWTSVTRAQPPGRRALIVMCSSAWLWAHMFPRTRPPA